jgi:serine/threonine protein kinase/WD40 repeat protein
MEKQKHFQAVRLLAMNEESIFTTALAKKTPEERTAYLQEACGNDDRLRVKVEGLLQAHEQAGNFMKQPAVNFDEADTLLPEPTDLREEKASNENDPLLGYLFAGRYKIREKLGEGGMGTVYVADQVQPVQRRVALKLIRGDFAGSSMLARFEQERQALALMDHPNIARVFDAGLAKIPGRAGEVSVPYFVMELIKGVPITQYCDDAKLTPKERLDLFIPVCQAVQHAHQKGIIHRDLKPSNILIGLYDDEPVPKVIDFGVAKATGPRISERTIYTEMGSLVGTLEYMSPEQAVMNNLDIDTRTDIYALGVVLYELLTGMVPFSQKDFAYAGLVQMLIIIKEVEPPKPSTKLSNSGSILSIAATRKLEPKKLTKLIKGDLDWIVLKCLEKDRSRRYETANALSMDIRRFLLDDIVLAGSPGAGYRLRKLLRRNKGRVLAFLAVAISLIAGIVALIVVQVKANSEINSLNTSLEKQRQRAVQLERIAVNSVRQYKDALFAKASAEFATKRALYFDRIILANQYWLENQLEQSNSILQECAPEERGWEWNYLCGRHHTDLFTLFWDPNARRGVRHLSHPSTGFVNQVSFGPGGAILGGVQQVRVNGLTGQVEKNFVLVDATTGKVRHMWPGGAGSLASSALLKDPNTGKLTQVRTDSAIKLAFSADGERFAVADQTGIRVWDVHSGTLLRAIPESRDWITAMALSDDGRLLAVTHQAAQPTDILGKPPVALRDAPAEIKVFDVKTGQARFSLHQHPTTVAQLAFSPKRDWLVSASDRAIRVWNLSKGTLQGELNPSKIRSGTNSILVFSRSGNLLVTAGDRTFQLWDIVLWRSRLVFQGHTSEVTDVTISPDETRLASGDAKEVILWDIASGQEIMSLPIPQGPVGLIKSLAWSTDGERLRAGLDNGSVLEWRGSPPRMTKADALANHLAQGNVNYHYISDVLNSTLNNEEELLSVLQVLSQYRINPDGVYDQIKLLVKKKQRTHIRITSAKILACSIDNLDESKSILLNLVVDNDDVLVQSSAFGLLYHVDKKLVTSSSELRRMKTSIDTHPAIRDLLNTYLPSSQQENKVP